MIAPLSGYENEKRPLWAAIDRFPLIVPNNNNDNIAVDTE